MPAFPGLYVNDLNLYVKNYRVREGLLPRWAECENRLTRLEAKFAEAAAQTTTTIGIDKLIDKVLSTLSRLDISYTEANVTRNVN